MAFITYYTLQCLFNDNQHHLWMLVILPTINLCYRSGEKNTNDKNFADFYMEHMCWKNSSKLTKNCPTEIVCKKLQTLGVLRWGCRMRVELPFNIMWCLQPCMLKDNDGKCSWKLLLVIQNIILVSNSSGPKKNLEYLQKKKSAKVGTTNMQFMLK